MIKYSLAWASGKEIDRSTTDQLDEAITMAKIMSRSSEHKPAQGIQILNEINNVIMFVHNGIRFIKEGTSQ